MTVSYGLQAFYPGTSRRRYRNYKRKWTKKADAKLVRLVGDGFSFTQAAAALSRTVPACKFRFYSWLLADYPPSISAVPACMEVSKDELPSFYEQGWKIVSFAGDRVTLEWPHKTAPKGARA